MGIVFRQSVKTTLVTFTGALLGALSIFIATKLSPQEWGFSKTILTQAIVFSQVVLMGVHSMLHLNATKYADRDKKPVLITIAVLTPLIVTALFTIPYIVLKEQVIYLFQPQDRQYVAKYFLWLPFYVLIWSGMGIFEWYLVSQMRVAIAVFMREIILRILTIIVLLLYLFQYVSFHFFIVSGILIHIAPLIGMIWVATKTENFRISFNFKAFSRQEYKYLADFAFFHLLLNMSMTLMGNIDLLMVATLDEAGMKSAAAYSIAIFMMSIFQIPFKAMSVAAVPALNNAYVSGDMDKVKDLFTRSGINIFIATMGMAAIIIANLHNLIVVIGDKYAGVDTLVLILLIGRAADMVTGLNGEMLSITRYYRYNFYLTVLLVVLMIGFNLLLIPVYGIYGAAWGATIAYTLFNIGKLLMLWWKMRLQPFSKQTWSVLIASVIAFACGYFLPHLPYTIPDTAVRTIIISIVYIILLILFRPSADLNAYLQSIKDKRRLF
jgi:O-antigen/teichoic acid export membrane protein